MKLRQGSGKEWPLRGKALKLTPLPRAYINPKLVATTHHPPEVSMRGCMRQLGVR